MHYPTLSIEWSGSVARASLNRPEARNALSRQLVADLLAFFTAIRPDRRARVVVLAGRGPAFCAGGDLREMQASAAEGAEGQTADAEQLDALLQAIGGAPQVVIACVHGPALGGGLGLVCAADMAIAAREATLGLPEVRLGVVPAVISPYVVARAGLAQARRLMLTGAVLDGEAAAAAGLVLAACPAGVLDEQVDALVRDVLRGGPFALATCKALLQEVAGKPPAETLAYRVDVLNRVRAGAEGQEGMRAFLERRKPGWVEE